MTRINEINATGQNPVRGEPYQPNDGASISFLMSQGHIVDERAETARGTLVYPQELILVDEPRRIVRSRVVRCGGRALLVRLCFAGCGVDQAFRPPYEGR